MGDARWSHVREGSRAFVRVLEMVGLTTLEDSLEYAKANGIVRMTWSYEEAHRVMEENKAGARLWSSPKYEFIEP